MADKKNRGRFTIQFNAADPQQAQVIDLLVRQGRHKAQFLTSVILHYLHCEATPDIPQPVQPSSEELETLVLQILRKHTSTLREPTPEERPLQRAEHLGAPEPVAPELAALLGPDVSSAIANTLSAFQCE